jgi:hypothetical protein
MMENLHAFSVRSAVGNCKGKKKKDRKQKRDVLIQVFGQM